VGKTIKLSSPATGEFWEIPVLWEDDHLLALHKPAGLLLSPDPVDAARPSLMQLFHRGIEKGAAWAKERNLSYLMNAHRLDAETGGVLLLARTKPALAALADQLGSEKPNKTFIAIVRGSPPRNDFASDAALSPHPLEPGNVRVDLKEGMRARTSFLVRERFPGAGCLLLECHPLTARPYQIRAHLKYLRLPIVGDEIYGGQPLLLSNLKNAYHLKPGHTERPLIATPALHAEKIIIAHPVTGAELAITAPWPKDFTVAVKYLRRYSVS
jgi:23S rRNA pseudouridine955/2504/2580 synthase